MLGAFVGYDEGVVLYKPTTVAGIASVPDDCVEVREVEPADIRQVIERMARNVEATAGWVGGDDSVAFNTLLGLSVEIQEYALCMGAELTVDQAYVNLRREEKERYIGSRAHARMFETEAKAGA